MALARLLEIIAFLIYIQESRGQFNNLINNNPTLGQNNLSQGVQNTANIKNVKDNLFQSENVGKSTNLNSQKQVNSQQSSIPQSSLPISSQFPLQQTQNFPQLINQLPHISEMQQTLSYQPQVSFVQQPSIVQHQPYNYLESPSAYVPVNNVGNINYHQQGAAPSILQVPGQVSQSAPVSSSYVPNYPSTSPAPSCGGRGMEFVANVGGNYLIPISALPFSIPEGQIVNTYTPLPYTAAVSTPNLTTLGNNIVMPYHNQNLGLVENPFDNFSETALGEELASFNSDKIAALLMSLLQTPKKGSKCLQSDYQGNSYAPYKTNQDTKPSSLKTLLPIILNLIKERREGCGCHTSCKCNGRNRNKKDSESQHGDYPKKRENHLKEEMFHADESEEDTHRITREHKKYKKINNPIPDVSIESNENDDYDNLSEEEED